VADLLAGGGIDRGGAGPGREGGCGRKTGHVADAGGFAATRGADAWQVHEVRPALGHRRGQLGIQRLEPGVDPDQLGQVLGEQPPTQPANLVTRPHRGEQGLVPGD
jgi:hypothetical protein